MERNLISTCQVCDCTRCARQNNCPNEEAACGECTPTNPASQDTPRPVRP